MDKNLKWGLWSLASGTVVALLTGVFLLTISLDMRLMSVWGLGLGFATALFLTKRLGGTPWIYGLVSAIPFSIFIYMVIMEDLPSLWFIIPLFMLVSLLGCFAAEQQAKSQQRLMISAGLLPIVFAVLIIPRFISGDLSVAANREVAAFSFVDLNEEPISSTDFKGKVVVLDFFGTWCRPCIAELPELARVRDHFKGNSGLDFYIVNSDQNRDTIEKARAFARKHDYGFQYGYDFKRQAYNTLGLKGYGVPSLAVLDRQGRVRMLHFGYNKAETDFVEKMVGVLQGLLDEG